MPVISVLAAVQAVGLSEDKWFDTPVRITRNTSVIKAEISRF